MQLLQTCSMLLSVFSYSRHITFGERSFQVLQFIYPLFFVGIAYVFVRNRVRGTLPRLFWAYLIAVMGLVTYFGLQLPLDFLLSRLNIGPFSLIRPGGWARGGWVWIQLGIGVTAYSIVLIAIARKKRS
jgi:hypothetical protein